MAKRSRAEQALRHSWSSPIAEGVAQNQICRIAVVGSGRYGCSAIAELMKSNGRCADYIAVDSESSNLRSSKAPKRILIGERSTTRKGANSEVTLTEHAIERYMKTLVPTLSKYEVVFIAADLCERTGADAATLTARLMKEKDIATIGVMAHHSKDTSAALARFQTECDTVICLDSGKLQDVSNTIRELIDIISSPNPVDFNLADFRSVIRKGGMAAIWTRESDSLVQAEEAVKNALANPSPDQDRIGAKGALIHVSSDNQTTIQEATRMSEIVMRSMDNDAVVVWGAHVDPEQASKLKVTLLVTGACKSSSSPILSVAAPSLFDIDPNSRPEKTLNVELDLYQLE